MLRGAAGCGAPAVMVANGSIYRVTWDVQRPGNDHRRYITGRDAITITLASPEAQKLGLQLSIPQHELSSVVGFIIEKSYHTMQHIKLRPVECHCKIPNVDASTLSIADTPSVRFRLLYRGAPLGANLCRASFARPLGWQRLIYCNLHNVLIE